MNFRQILLTESGYYDTFRETRIGRKIIKILLLDVETSPNIVYSWAVGKKISLTPENIIKERQIICVCYKWLDEKTVQSLDWGKAQSDKPLLKSLSKILNDADVVVAHNGDKYDLKFINGRLAYHDLPPLKPTTSIDTLKQSRRTFFINSHRLDYLGQYLGEGRKLDTGGFKLWKSVVEGDEKALAKMIRYCKQDVKLLEKVYLTIRKYAPQTVHMGVLANKDQMSCKSCGSSNTHWDGYRVMSTVVYRCRKCNDCSHFWRTSVRSENGPQTA